MVPQHFGDVLRQALEEKGVRQAELARRLGTDASQVNRWVRNKAIPLRENMERISEVLDIDLADSFAASAPEYELYVSSPITSLPSDGMAEHHDAVAKVVDAARAHVNSLYWPGEQIVTATDLQAADLFAEHNLAALATCSAYLYVQFTQIARPTGALVELGFALGRRLKTTIVLGKGVTVPYMLDGFGGVAGRLKFLPAARVYTNKSLEEATALIARNGRELLGLN